MRLVQPYTLFNGSAADWIAAVALLTLLSTLAAYGVRRRDAGTGDYLPTLAWLRALAYFSAALLLSWSLGVLQALLNSPLVTDDQLTDPWWQAATLFYLVVLWVGYGLLWPRGTFTDGRRRHLFIATVYGLLWGLCHGQVFLSIWAIVELSGLNAYWVAALTYLLLSGYNFAYHQFFWDLYVSPPHNIEAWNLKKVQFCHAPNLLLGLAWLATWGNFSMWLLLQTAALLACVHAMRFPAWYDDYRARAGEMR
jgi:hypothetical protein